jgi:hypothetical protein
MDKIKIEAFLSIPPKSNDIRLSEILETLKNKFGDKILIDSRGKEDELFASYNLTQTPALVIGEMIKIMGFCPSEDSIISALNDLGM